MEKKIFAAWEACLEYAYWGETKGGEKLVDAVGKLMLQGSPEKGIKSSAWWKN